MAMAPGGWHRWRRPESPWYVRQERDDHVRAGRHRGQLLGGHVLPGVDVRVPPGVRPGAGVLREAPQRGGVVVPGPPVHAVHGRRRRPPRRPRRAPVAPVREAEAGGRQVGRRRLLPVAARRPADSARGGRWCRRRRRRPRRRPRRPADDPVRVPARLRSGVRGVRGARRRRGGRGRSGVRAAGPAGERGEGVPGAEPPPRRPRGLPLQQPQLRPLITHARR